MAKELRKSILETDDSKTEMVVVPEWGDAKIMVRSLNARERAKLVQTSMSGPTGTFNFERWQIDLLIATACDPDTGDKIFEAADRDTLLKKNSAAVARITDVAQVLSGLGEAAVEAAKANFNETQSDDSASS